MLAKNKLEDALKDLDGDAKVLERLMQFVVSEDQPSNISIVVDDMSAVEVYLSKTESEKLVDFQEARDAVLKELGVEEEDKVIVCGQSKLQLNN